MKAAFVTDVEKVEVKEIEKPVITDTEVLIKAKTVGVCGSDLHLFRGTHPFRHAPAILGHEIAGEVVEVGSRVTKFNPGTASPWSRRWAADTVRCARRAI